VPLEGRDVTRPAVTTHLGSGVDCGPIISSTTGDHLRKEMRRIGLRDVAPDNSTKQRSTRQKEDQPRQLQHHSPEGSKTASKVYEGAPRLLHHSQTKHVTLTVGGTEQPGLSRRLRDNISDNESSLLISSEDNTRVFSSTGRYNQLTRATGVDPATGTRTNRTFALRCAKIGTGESKQSGSFKAPRSRSVGTGLVRGRDKNSVVSKQQVEGGVLPVVERSNSGIRGHRSPTRGTSRVRGEDSTSNKSIMVVAPSKRSNSGIRGRRSPVRGIVRNGGEDSIAKQSTAAVPSERSSSGIRRLNQTGMNRSAGEDLVSKQASTSDRLSTGVTKHQSPMRLVHGGENSERNGRDSRRPRDVVSGDGGLLNKSKSFNSGSQPTSNGGSTSGGGGGGGFRRRDGGRFSMRTTDRFVPPTNIDCSGNVEEKSNTKKVPVQKCASSSCRSQVPGKLSRDRSVPDSAALPCGKEIAGASVDPRYSKQSAMSKRMEYDLMMSSSFGGSKTSKSQQRGVGRTRTTVTGHTYGGESTSNELSRTPSHGESFERWRSRGVNETEESESREESDGMKRADEIARLSHAVAYNLSVLSEQTAIKDTESLVSSLY